MHRRTSAYRIFNELSQNLAIMIFFKYIMKNKKQTPRIRGQHAFNICFQVMYLHSEYYAFDSSKNHGMEIYVIEMYEYI